MMMYGRVGITERTAFSSPSRFCRLSISQVSIFSHIYPVFTDTSIEFYGYVIINFCLHGYELVFIGIKNVSNRVVEKNEAGFFLISDLS
jgi:hypothetical protein